MARFNEDNPFLSALRGRTTVRPPLASNDWQRRFAKVRLLFKRRDTDLPEPGPDLTSLVSEVCDDGQASRAQSQCAHVPIQASPTPLPLAKPMVAERELTHRSRRGPVLGVARASPALGEVKRQQTEADAARAASRGLAGLASSNASDNGALRRRWHQSPRRDARPMTRGPAARRTSTTLEPNDTAPNQRRRTSRFSKHCRVLSRLAARPSTSAPQSTSVWSAQSPSPLRRHDENNYWFRSI